MDSKLPEENDDESHCTVDELNGILTFDTGGMTMLPSRSMDLVYPGIYVGEEEAARNTVKLQQEGITHVLNTAKGTTKFHSSIHPSIYEKAHITFKAIEASDMESFPLNMHFDETSDFIEDVLSGGGKVLVYCKVGASRSATIVLAFLMMKRQMTAQKL